MLCQLNLGQYNFCKIAQKAEFFRKFQKNYREILKKKCKLSCKNEEDVIKYKVAYYDAIFKDKKLSQFLKKLLFLKGGHKK